MVPKIVETNADLEVHGMAQYFEEIHRDESVDVVRFMRRFVPGTRVGDLCALAGRWNELSALDAERAAALKRKDVSEIERLRTVFSGIGVALKDTRDPKTGEIVTAWEVARRETTGI
jgi:hypothetical protein